MDITASLYSLFMIVIITAVILNEIWYHKTKIPAAPTLPGVRKAMLALAAAHLRGRDDDPIKIADLGCGWGGVTMALAAAFPAAQVEGFELSPAPWLVSKIRACFCRRVRVRRCDLEQRDLRGYDLVVCYLCPPLMNRLKDKFAQELKPGALVICNAFEVPGWTPLDKRIVGKRLKIPVFLYRKK